MKKGSEVGGRPGEDGSASHMEVASWGGWFQRMVVSQGGWHHRAWMLLGAGMGRSGFAPRT